MNIMELKNKLFTIFCLLLLAAMSLTVCRSSQCVSKVSAFFSGEIEALAYSNEGPGPQGQRHSQAVWCGGGGWVIRAGCCYGMDECTYVYCPTNVFSCDGNTWYSF